MKCDDCKEFKFGCKRIEDEKGAFWLCPDCLNRYRMTVEYRNEMTRHLNAMREIQNKYGVKKDDYQNNQNHM